MAKFAGIEWAPIALPIQRRMQTLAVAFMLLDNFTFPISAMTLVCLLFTPFFPVTLLYMGWWFYDRPTCQRGGYKRRWARYLPIWKDYCAYFPVRLIKTTDIDANRNYIFASHPHGILPFGGFGNFATEGTGFSTLFPGLTPHLLTLSSNLIAPFHRELYQSLGFSCASKENMEWLLNNEGTGQILFLVPGGARESLDAIPGKMDLTLNCRKGFVKIALANGADLVPVINYGENDIFNVVDRPESSLVRIVQQKVLKITGVAPPVFKGRGIFQYSLGLLPFRKPITSVVGKPIRVDKVVNPTNQQIESLHKLYVEQLTTLYYKHRDEFGYSGVELNLKN